MRVFVVGATGAIGARFVPQLIEHGHEVIGTHRSPGNADRVRALGAEPVTLDLLDAGAVRRAVLAGTGPLRDVPAAARDRLERLTLAFIEQSLD